LASGQEQEVLVSGRGLVWVSELELVATDPGQAMDPGQKGQDR